MYSEEFSSKVKLFTDAARFEKTATVPNLSNDYTWKICDSEFSYEEAYYDYEKMEKTTVDFHNRYDFDAYLDLGTRNHFPMMDALGGGSYTLNKENGAVNIEEKAILFPEEYEDFARNPMVYYYKCFARKFPETTTENFIKACGIFMQDSQFSGKMDHIFATQFNRPTMITTSSSVLPPLDIFHNSLRGVKGISIDIRRNKVGLKEAMDSYWESMVKPGLERALKKEKATQIADVYTGLLAYQVLNVKQFEEIYYPYLKHIIDRTIEEGKLIYLFCEDTMMRFAEFFQDIPRGYAIMHIEMDNIFEVRKKLPNMCIAGGMTTDLLGNGTSQQCVNYAKKLIDEMGEGYIMSQNKMLSFTNDCKRKNLLAVNEFIRNYKL